MKTYGGRSIAPYILSFGAIGRWVVSFTLRSFYLRKNLSVGVGPRVSLDAVAKTKYLFVPGIECRSPSPYRSYYTDWAIAGAKRCHENTCYHVSPCVNNYSLTNGAVFLNIFSNNLNFFVMSSGPFFLPFKLTSALPEVANHCCNGQTDSKYVEAEKLIVIFDVTYSSYLTLCSCPT